MPVTVSAIFQPYSAIMSLADPSPQILILIFAEVLGLYGLIVALILNTNSSVDYQVNIYRLKMSR